MDPGLDAYIDVPTTGTAEAVMVTNKGGVHHPPRRVSAPIDGAAAFGKPE